VNGAARLGKISYKFVESRILNKTYGVKAAFHILEAQQLGIDTNHINNYKFTHWDGDDYVNGCFDIFFQKKEKKYV